MVREDNKVRMEEECARGGYVRAIVATQFGTSVTDTGWVATIKAGLMDRASIEKYFGRGHLATRHSSEAPLCPGTMHLEELLFVQRY